MFLRRLDSSTVLIKLRSSYPSRGLISAGNYFNEYHVFLPCLLFWSKSSPTFRKRTTQRTTNRQRLGTSSLQSIKQKQSYNSLSRLHTPQYPLTQKSITIQAFPSLYLLLFLFSSIFAYFFPLKFFSHHSISFFVAVSNSVLPCALVTFPSPCPVRRQSGRDT